MKQPIRSFAMLALFFVLASPALAGPDIAGPEISAVSPLTAQYTVPQQFSVSALDEAGVASCTLLVSSTYETPMTYDSVTGMWSVTYTFTTFRSANSIRAVCVDTYGNSTNGPSKIISVSDAPIVVSPGDGTPVGGDPITIDATEWPAADVIAESPVLIKTVCPGNEDFTHPCRTVYFLDHAGKRHAFTNEKAFFTWYTNYDQLHLVSTAVMASYPLGPNVRYRPGVKMIKFPSVSTVYAVGRYGSLFPIGSESVAEELYGTNWNQQIDDVSEVFATNYTIDSWNMISSASQFDRSIMLSSVNSINDNLGEPIFLE
ncbi:TPA: hypothetical protein DEB00_00185 [Candidatus Uhrbacteria bacterium]|nr:hypothetical protein [Candidatus Uhrbacteria bacterium]